MNGLLTRREWLIAGACLLLFAALATLNLAPRLQAKLTQAATTKLQSLDHQAGGARFDRVALSFDGQRALITGAVRHQQDGLRLIHSLNHDLRTPGNPFNPVTKVTATSSLEVKPLQSGWLVAAVQGFNAEIIGTCATPQERDTLEQSLRSRWPTWRGKINFALQVDPRRFDESSAWLATVRSLPAPEARGQKSARLFAAQIGRTWTDLPLQTSAPSPAPIPPPLHALGITSNEWQDRVLSHHDAVLSHLQKETAWEIEQERLRNLPPAHVFLGKRGNQVLLRGEVFDIDSKRAVIASIMAALPEARLLDDLRANGTRRPDPGLGSFNPSETLSDTSDKAFALGLPGKPWTPLDWEVARSAQPWSSLLPPGLDPKSLAEDSALVIDWLQGSNAGIPLLPTPPQPAFLTLAVYQDRIMISGRLAEQALHTQILAALKRAYPSGYTIDDQIAVSGSTLASDSVQHTTQTIPVRQTDPLLFAIALPGKPWQTLSPTDVASLASLPIDQTLHDLPSQTLATAFAPALEEIRSLGLSFPEPPSRAKEDPGNKP
jgi:hypothetical protein